MNKKRISILIGFLVIVALLAGASGASAQTDSLPIHSSQDNTPFSHAQESVTSSLAAPDALSLGQSGTSFRYVNTIGVTNEPYVSDTDHINSPHGIFIDSTDNLYVAEIYGQRVLKYDSSGTNLLEIGVAGVPWHHDNYLSEPRDVAVDSNGNTWVVMTNALKQFDADGNALQVFPVDDPWTSADDNGHFNIPQGIAFDNSGLLYVADSANQRIQIFDVSGETPVYQGTIGVTGQARSDNSGFDWPHRIAFDSLNRLYVADEANFRVQRCTYSTNWTCETFFGITDEYGSDASHLGSVYGLTVYGDSLYIADTSNYRVLKCDLNANCSDFAGEPGISGSDNDHFNWPTDVAIDSTGNVYVADETNSRVQIFDSTGAYKDTRGVTSVPYVVDNIRLNTPWGVIIANDGGLLVTENMGHRLVKYDSNLVQEWAFGTAGVSIMDNAFSSIEGKAAQDATGKIYVSDTWDHQVIILSDAGQYLGALGTIWQPGDDNAHFNAPQGIAVSPVNQDIYVVDTNNQRIQVFTKDRFYKATLGVTGEAGSDDQHFWDPRDVAIDGAGSIYVADGGNTRVQKCTLSNSIYSCTTLAGEIGVLDNAFNHFYPQGITVDSAGNVYVADDWNTRVQVYDNTGKYLTTISGSWGVGNSQLSSAMGVAVDGEGMVYVTDRLNHRIQRYASGYPNWKQSNLNGFGEISNRYITTLDSFNTDLYAGTYNPTTGGQLWRMTPDGKWHLINENGFGNPVNVAVNHLIDFKGNLYASTWADEIEGGELWRINSPTDWSRVVDNGFDDPTNGEIFHLAVFDDQLYATTWSYSNTHGTEIWRSSTGDSGSWSKVVSNGFDEDANNQSALSMAVFNGTLYAGTLNYAGGAEIWRSSTGALDSWAQVNEDGFGTSENQGVLSLAVFNNVLYASTQNRNNGGQIWRSTNGTDWTKVIDTGFGNQYNSSIEQLFIFKNQIWAVTRNSSSEGLEVWNSPDGITWSAVLTDGFGDGNNYGGFWGGHSGAIHNGQLFLGTDNIANGGEIWSYETEHTVYIPLVLNLSQQTTVSTWKKITSPTTNTLRAIDMISSGVGWAVGDNGTIVCWNGSNWSNVTSPTSNNLNSVTMTSSTDGWAVGDGGTIVRWNGSTWSGVTSPTSSKLNSVSMISPTDGWAVGNGGTIIRWNGNAWSLSTSPTTYDLYGLAFLSSNDVWAVGGSWNTSIGWYEDAKLHWNGSNWTLYTAYRTLDILYAVDFISPTNGWAVGINNAKTIWNGTSWQDNYSLESMGSHYGLDMLTAEDGWAVGWDNLKSNIRHWNGSTWLEEPSPVTGELYSISMISKTEGWAVGENGNILKYGR